MKWIENASIFIAHILLLMWILKVLNNSGIWPLDTVLYHFVGLSLAGALLIRGSAFIIKRRHLIELSRKS